MNRYAAMYIPNTEWVFLDAISKSDQCKVAFANEELSTQGKNVKKYLKIAAEDRLRQYRQSQKSTTPQPPPHIIELLKLQSSRGKFESLADVLTCLFMPQAIQFRHDHLFTEWEKATAFAIAAMRQHNQFFDYLCDSHDKAFATMDSNEILFEARELLNAYQFTEVEMGDTMNDTTSLNLDEHRHKDDVFGTEILESAEMGSLGTSQQHSSHLMQQGPMLSTAQLAQAFHGLGTIEEGEDTSVATAAVEAREEEEGELDLAEFAAAEECRREGEDSSGQVSPSFSALQERLVQLSANRDEVKIAAQQDVVNRLQLEVISQCIGIEKLVQEVHVVTERCVQAYCAAETRSHRCKQFDELTCMLGEGREASAGFPDWRGRGVRGVRPVMVRFFLTMQRLAEERLSLAELEQPGARRLDEKIRPEVNLGRWKLLWNGHDVVHKVLHCLDFLRKCRELSEWYGPSFYFVANPLMLPFPLHPSLEQRALDVETQVSDQQLSVPHLRLGTLRPGGKQEWEHQKHLNQWRRQFQTLAECWAFNWPSVPDTKEDVANAVLHETLLVICTTCQATLKRSFLWEKKFISQIHSVRGQDKHLIGRNTSKVDKKLDIPPDIARKPRLGQNDPLDIRRRSTVVGSQQQYNSNRRASEASSFAPYGYSLVSSSQSQSGGLSDFSQEEAGEDDSQEGLQRPNLAKVMQFNTMVKTAEEKAALKAKQQLAAMRKTSVLNRASTLSPSRRGTHLSGRKTRSPSIAAQVGGAASALPGTRRTASSRPSISAGSASPPGKLSAIHSNAMRKSSSASAAGMGLAPGLRRPSAAVEPPTTSRKHSTIFHSPPASSSAKISSSSKLGIPSGLLLRKSSSASAGLGKFASPSRAPSTARLLSAAGAIEEENSVDGLEGTDIEAPERLKQGKKARLSTALPPAPLGSKRSGTLRKDSTASVAAAKFTPSSAASQEADGKSQRISVPYSSAQTISSLNSADNHLHANIKSTPKNSTLSEGSIDNTSESLALASPLQSPANKKSVHRKTLSHKASTVTATAEAGATSSAEERAASPKKQRKKSKRGSVLKIDAATTPSSVVTRLPPVQGQLRLTRRRGEEAVGST